MAQLKFRAHAPQGSPMSIRLRCYEKPDWPEVLALWIEAWTRVRADIDFAAARPGSPSCSRGRRARAPRSSSPWTSKVSRDSCCSIRPGAGWSRSPSTRGRRAPAWRETSPAREGRLCGSGGAFRQRGQHAGARLLPQRRVLPRRRRRQSAFGFAGLAAALGARRADVSDLTAAHTDASASTPALNCNRASRA